MENIDSENSVAVITTGGTIGSVATDSVRYVKENQDHISGRIHSYCETYNIKLDVVSPINRLSETFEPVDWVTIIHYIDEKVSEGYDSIIVTHGTDTMAYTAAATYLTQGESNSRIIFTGAMNGPESVESDVEIALKSSLTASVDSELPYGVYVNLRSSESIEKTHLYSAIDVSQLSMYDTGFRSASENPLGVYSESDGWKWEREIISERPPILFDRTPMEKEIENVRNLVQLRTIQPGITLTSDNIDPKTDVLILSTYHSGTGPNSPHPEGLKQFIEENPVEVVLAGVCKEMVPNPYKTTVDLCESGATLIYDVQPYIVYVSLCIGLALGFEVDAILEMLQ